MKKTAKSKTSLTIKVGDIRGTIKVVAIYRSYRVTPSEACDRDCESGYFVDYEGEDISTQETEAAKKIRENAAYWRAAAADDFELRYTDEYRAAIAAEKALTA